MGRQGAYILGPHGPLLSDREAGFFREADPWGFILFQRNCQSPDQLRRLTDALRASVGRDAPILIDQEGGRVQRMRAPHWREYLPPLDQVERAGEDAARAMYLRACLIGAELRDVGIDVNCIPSCDIATNQTHAFLRNRCYGTSAGQVTANAKATADGLMAAGCLPVMKHAPGHGRASLDSHFELPRIDVPLSELMATDFAPFRALGDLPMAMTAHIVIPEVDPSRPVTQSSEGVALLRQSLGIRGLLMTDDISMNALEGTVVERGQRALQAGCDLVLHCNGNLDEMIALPDALGSMTADAAARADAALAAKRSPEAIDIRALETELEALQAGVSHA